MLPPADTKTPEPRNRFSLRMSRLLDAESTTRTDGPYTLASSQTSETASDNSFPVSTPPQMQNAYGRKRRIGSDTPDSKLGSLKKTAYGTPLVRRGASNATTGEGY